VRTFALGDTVFEVDSGGPLHDLDAAVVIHLVRTENGELLALDAVIPHPKECHAL
jgi:hypothetical protein